eukprot:NODE_242_length_11906_cov_0.577454.p6 type:complete len:108 gc:universal NODE_242_length_11906_cov_0.577454:7773-8096(+)
MESFVQLMSLRSSANLNQFEILNSKISDVSISASHGYDLRDRSTKNRQATLKINLQPPTMKVQTPPIRSGLKRISFNNIDGLQKKAFAIMPIMESNSKDILIPDEIE